MGKLFVYNVHMAEIVKYNNDMNDVVFADFTDTELKIFFAICSQIRDKQNNEVIFTFDQLKSLTDEKRHYRYMRKLPTDPLNDIISTNKER